MTGGPIRPDPTDRIKRFVSAQQFLAGVFMSVISGIVGASRFARSQPSRPQASA